MPSGRSSRELQVFDPVLTNVARNYKPHGFVYDEVCMHQPVDAISGQYPIFDPAYFFGDDVDNKVADRGETPEIELKYSLDTYLCEDYALKVSITPRERQQLATQGGRALRLEQAKTNLLVTRMATRRERRLAAVLKKTSNGGQLTSGAGATAAFATSTAVEADWKTAKTTVYNLCGVTPNIAIVPYLKAYDLATNATLRDIWKYQVNAESFISLGGGPNGEELFLPKVFHGTRLIIPKGALYNSAKEGATQSNSEVWGSSVIFLYKDDTDEWGNPSTVYSFDHPTLTVQGDGGPGFVIDRWHENDPVKDLIRATECRDEKVCGPDTGYELTGV